MVDKAAFINNLADKASQVLGGSKGSAREDIEHNLKALIGSALAKFELVNRDEFDAQVAVLRHTRERLEALEQKVEALELENKG